MLQIHKKIIREVVREKSEDPKVVGIFLFGSLAKGKAHKNSDVDIEVIYLGKKYKNHEELRNGIKVDYEFWPKSKLLERMKNYPFLSYPYLSEKILYDKLGLLKNIKKQTNIYFKKHPAALKEWRSWEKSYNLSKISDKNIMTADKFYRLLKHKFRK